MGAKVAFPAGLRPRFEPLRGLGSGGFGVVFLARDTELGREVAVKVLARDLTEDVRARFRREARLMARLEDPHVVRLYDFDAAAEHPYLVMEYLERAPEPPADPLPFLLDVATGLDAIHGLGLVHRDVKPANMMWTTAGRGVLLDLGLTLDPGGGTAITRSGAIVGTLSYLAPEFFEGRSASAASDWFAWGASLYELVDGRRLREGITFAQLVAGATRVAPDFTRIPRTSQLARLLRACLATNPDRRPRDAGEIRRLVGGRSLEELLLPASGSSMADPDRTASVVQGQAVEPPRGRDARPPRSRPDGRAFGLAAAIALLGLGLSLPAGAPAPGPGAPTPKPERGALRGDRDPPPPAPGAGTQMVRRLAAEFEEILEARWSEEGERLPPGDPGGLGIQDALFTVGTVLLDELSGQRAYLDWLEAGGTAADLPAAAREALGKLDDEFLALGFPPPFTAALLPRPVPGDSAGGPGSGGELPPLPESWKASVEVLRPSRLPPGHPASGPLVATWRAVLEAARHHASLAQASRRGELRGAGATELGAQGVVLLMGETPGELTVLAGGLRASPEGRALLRDHFAAGTRATQRVLLRATALLEVPGIPDVAHLTRSLLEIQGGLAGFLMGSGLSASRTRLFGSAPRSRWATLLQAEFMTTLERLRTRALLPRAPLRTDLPALWAAVRDRALEDGDDPAAAGAWMRQLEAFGDARRWPGFMRSREEFTRLRALLPEATRRELNALELRASFGLMEEGRRRLSRAAGP